MAMIKCNECNNEVSTTAESCPKCGAILKKKTGCFGCLGRGLLILFVLGVIGQFVDKKPSTSRPKKIEAHNNLSTEPTSATSSSYNQDIFKATTSKGLSKADLAWHAQNTYGWNCSEVVSIGEMTSSGYFFIECSNGKKLRVYPREGKHPRITNLDGGYN